jgi:uncharacterized membrane protein
MTGPGMGRRPGGGGPPPVLLAILALAFLIVGGVLLVSAVAFASRRLGVSEEVALLALWTSLLGSWVNIPVARVRTVAQPLGEVRVFGVRYVVQAFPPVRETVVAINVGGALVPVAISALLLARSGAWGPAAGAVAVVSVLAYLAARPVEGVGIVLPTLLAPAAAAVCAVVLAPDHSAAVAYAAGSLGALVGADLLHLRQIGRLGAAVVSIGGAGTFDGIFVSGLVAVLLATL